MKKTSYESRFDEIPERVDQLSPRQKFVLDIFMSATRINHVVFNPDIIVDLVQGIPETLLTYPVARLASQEALGSDLSHYNDENGNRIAVKTSNERWLAVQQEFASQVLSARGARALILKPFFIALAAGDLEAAKLVMGEKYLAPEYFFANRSSIPEQRFVQEWNELVELGIIKRAWDEGEQSCHWELDSNVFAAFMAGFRGKIFEEDLKYTRYVFGEARKDK